MLNVLWLHTQQSCAYVVVAAFYRHTSVFNEWAAKRNFHPTVVDSISSRKLQESTNLLVFVIIFVIKKFKKFN